VFFVSPYFYHDAFMHHTMHLLDAPGGDLCFSQHMDIIFAYQYAY